MNISLLQFVFGCIAAGFLLTVGGLVAFWCLELTGWKFNLVKVVIRNDVRLSEYLSKSLGLSKVLDESKIKEV